MSMKVKKCTVCKESKEYNAEIFRLDNRKKSGLGTWCRSCHAIYRNKYYADNKKKECAIGLKYREANREKINARGREYKRANKDQIRAQNKKYRQENKHITNADHAKRRATKLKATPAWANQGYINLFYEGAKIEEKRTGRNVHVDHIVPLQGELVCGLHCEDNLQLLFAEDNLSKSNKFEVEV